ncbi:MAG: sodium:proton antiporter [Clostridiales bacterium]|nr:sodium:proton antiporter [Clostridiales bacterium]
MNIQNAYDTLYMIVLGVISLLLIACFIRAVKGPSIADRIVAINMIGTQIIIMAGVIASMWKEGYLIDVSILYAMISFLAVVVLCKVYMGVFLERQANQGKEGQDHA